MISRKTGRPFRQPADSSVAILKRVDFFKLYMKINQIMKRFLRKLIIFFQKMSYFFCDFFRRCGFNSTHFVRKFFIFTYGKPIFSAIAGSIF